MLEAELAVYAPQSLIEAILLPEHGRSDEMSGAAAETVEALKAVGYLR